MIEINALAQRLIRMGPPDYGWHLERVPVSTVDEALAWQREWYGADGVSHWMGVSDAERRRAVKWWLAIRHWHAAEWRQRGGLDA